MTWIDPELDRLSVRCVTVALLLLAPRALRGQDTPTRTVPDAISCSACTITARPLVRRGAEDGGAGALREVRVQDMAYEKLYAFDATLPDGPTACRLSSRTCAPSAKRRGSARRRPASLHRFRCPATPSSSAPSPPGGRCRETPPLGPTPRASPRAATTESARRTPPAPPPPAGAASPRR